MWAVLMLQSWSLRRRLRSSISNTGRRAPAPQATDQVRVEGYPLMRILVMGSGLAVGSGVTRRADAVDGHLAGLLAAATGRGVYVLNVAATDRGLNDQILSASISATLDLEDVVIWSPSVLEMCTSRWPRRWESRLGELLAFTTSTRRVVVLTLPVTRGEDPVVAMSAELAVRINEHLRRAARRHPNVVVVDPPMMSVPRAGAPTLDSAYYAEMAASIADALLPAPAPRPMLESTETVPDLHR